MKRFSPPAGPYVVTGMLRAAAVGQSEQCDSLDWLIATVIAMACAVRWNCWHNECESARKTAILLQRAISLLDEGNLTLSKLTEKSRDFL